MCNKFENIATWELLDELRRRESLGALDEMLAPVEAAPARAIRTGERDFVDMAEDVGLPRRAFYSVSEVAQVTGIPKTSLYEEMNTGTLRYTLQKGRKRGRMIRLECLNEWLKEGER